MARLKRVSAVLDRVARRMAGMRSIDQMLEFGNGLSLAEYDTCIQTLQTQISSYNTMLSGLDEMTGRIALLEQDLRSYSERMLMSVETRYDKDSLEYIQAGGKPRKRSTRNSINTPPTNAIASVAVPDTEMATSNGTKATVS